jgi:hypothetical protein
MITSVNPLEHFRDLVRSAIGRQGLKTNEMAEFYLINLLSDHVSAERLSKEPLAVSYLRALESHEDTQAKIMKRVGDYSLFVAGFFSDSLKRKVVDIDYYMAIGSSSYKCLSGICSRDLRRRHALASLFKELSEKFSAFADILSEVSETSMLTDSRDILRLYERWLRTRSKRAEKLLKGIGIEPVATGTRPLH